MSAIDIIVPDFIQKSVLVKLTLAVLTVMALTGAVGFFFYQGLNQELNDQVDRQVEASTVHHENAYNNWFDNRLEEVDALEGVIIDNNVQYRDDDQISQFLLEQKLSRSNNQIRDYHYVNASSGQVEASSDRAFVGENLYGEGPPTFDQDTLQQDQFVLPKQYDSADGTDVIAVGAYLRFPQNENAILLAEINTTNPNVGPTIEQSIEGAETGVVSASDDYLLGNQPAISRPDGDGNLTVTESGGNIYAYRQIQSYENLYVVTETPKTSAFAVRNIVLQNFGLTLGFAFLFLLLVVGAGGWVAIRDLNSLAGKAEQMGEGDLEVDLETSRKDEIGVLYSEFDDMRTDLKERITEAEDARDEAESARKEAEVARAEAEEMATYLQERAEEYSTIMQEVGMGDMTQRMEPDGEEESMDRIAEEFNDMIEELEKTTGQLKSYVDEVEQAGAEVEQSAGTVREASEQVADSIQKISDDAYNQKERLQQISEKMDEITDDLEQIAAQRDDVHIDEPLEHIRDIANDITEVAELSEETMAESEHVAGAAEEQAAELNEVSERANDLQRYAQPLRDILERFDTEAEHEFVFSVGPTGGAESPGMRNDGE